MVHAIGGLVTVAPSKGEVAFCKIGGSGDLVGASALVPLLWQMVEGKLKVVDDFPEELLVCVLRVRGLLRGPVFIDLLIYPWHLAEHGDELEIEVGTQEADLCFTLCGGLGAEHVAAVLFE